MTTGASRQWHMRMDIGWIPEMSARLVISKMEKGNGEGEIQNDSLVIDLKKTI